MAVVSMSYLLEAGVHFGHQTKRWNPKMKEYIFTSRDDIYIIDLEKTAACIETAYAEIKKIAENGGSFLFVGTKKQAQEASKEEAERSESFYVVERWLGGTLTNFRTIRKRIKRLEEIEKMENDGTFDVLPKKEVIGLKKEYEKENSIVNILKLAFKTLLVGYILVLIVLSLLHFANINYVYDLGLSNYTNTTSLALVLSQLGIYIWAFVNLIPVNLGIGTISILSLFNSSLSLDVILLLGSLIALSALIFIIVGCKLESKYKTKDIKPVIMFSICYSILMGIIGLLTTLYIGDNAASMLTSISAMQMGFNFFIGIVISFVYSFATTLIGYKLNIFN